MENFFSIFHYPSIQGWGLARLSIEGLHAKFSFFSSFSSLFLFLRFLPSDIEFPVWTKAAGSAL